MKADVQLFQRTMASLLSMLHRCALERLAVDDSKEFPVLDNIGMTKLDFLAEVPDRCELIYQWILRLMTLSSKNGVLDIPPPILARCYEEVSQGMSKLHNVMKITTIALPFPYVQMTVILLVIHCLLTPVIACLIMHNWRWCACLAFMSVFCLWAIFYIALHLEVPFGQHRNALPCFEMQNDMNRVLSLLLKRKFQEKDARTDPACIVPCNTSPQEPPPYDCSPDERNLNIVVGRTGSISEYTTRQQCDSWKLIEIAQEEDYLGSPRASFSFTGLLSNSLNFGHSISKQSESHV